MKFSTILTGLTTAIGFVAAAPVLEARQSGTCSSPRVRKEWRTMGVLERANYLVAVQCMMIKPSRMRSTYPNAKTRWDDFISIHKAATVEVHFVPQFLPWHRAFLHEFETALREECFYQFSLPYWDQSLDAANWAASPLFNDFLGFGGNGKEVGGDPQFPGSTGGGCISSGIFKHTKVHIDYADKQTSGISRCIKRAFFTGFTQMWLGGHRITQALQATNFAQFEQILEGDVNFADLAAALGIHNVGHTAVGGDMSDMFISSGDPLFFLHHANIDRIWYLWQNAQASRKYEVSGKLAPRTNPMLVWPNPPAGDLTLNFELNRLRVPGSSSTLVKVGQVTNTEGRGLTTGGAPGLLCYKYN